MIYWLTGQPGAGKTTLGNWLIAALKGEAVLVDGDDIREIFENKDYSEQGRRKNIELAQNIAHFLNNKKMNPVVCLVSPYRDQRENFKQKMGKDIVELYIHTTDIRGRESYHVSNYEPPLENFIDVDTTNKPEFESLQEIGKKLIF
jgi:adenylylsulfate kinase-like enzyme